MTCARGYAVAASPDLVDWTSAYLPENGGVMAGDEGLRIGRRLAWTPEDGF